MGVLSFLRCFMHFFPLFSFLLSSSLLSPSSGMLAPRFPAGRNNPGMLQLRVAQPVPHGLRAGEGGVRGGAALQGLR